MAEVSDFVIGGGYNPSSDCKIREWEISFIRLVATGMIIICHICQKYDLEMMYWFNAGVQIFLYMSGWLYGKKKINDSVGFLKKNLLKVLLDYWMYLLIMILIYFVFARDEITVGMAVNALVGAGTITGMGHLWFMAFLY